MVQRWSVQAVDKAAPDDQVRAAGRRLAIPTAWSDVGVAGTLLFGRCRGSGKDPYQVAVDLAGPRYRCSCPSRKFPCKHCVALLYLWAEGRVDSSGVAADFAAQWQADQANRSDRATRTLPRREEEPDGERVAAAAARLAEREQRVDAGLADCARFLADLVTHGLAADPVGRPRRLTEQAARLVDAQAPGLAARLRDLALISDAQPGWVEDLTEGLGRAQLLIRAWLNRAALPADLAATVRAHVGFTVRTDEVLRGPGVTDTWVVTGLRDSDEDRVSIRRVWLWGLTTGRPALVLFFAAGGAPLVSPLFPGTAVDATLHFYPGRPVLRAALGERVDQALPVGAWRPVAVSVADARRQWRDALAADPWTGQWPVIVSGRVTAGVDAGFGLADASGARVALWGEKSWGVAALLGGGEGVVLGEISRAGVLPTAVVLEDRLVVL